MTEKLTDEALERLAAFQQDGEFEYEANENYASRRGSPIQGHVIRYDPNPRKNSDGSTSHGFNFPALVASDLLGNASETMAEVAEQLNACPAMARELLALRRATPADDLRAALTDALDLLKSFGLNDSVAYRNGIAALAQKGDA